MGVPIHFKLLDPAVTKKLLEGHEDILTGESAKAEALYRQHPKCQNGCGKTMEKSSGGVTFAFSDPNWHIPRCVMKCYACGFTLNPFDGMVVAAGDRSKAKYGNIPLIDPDKG